MFFCLFFHRFLTFSGDASLFDGMNGEIVQNRENLNKKLSNYYKKHQKTGRPEGRPEGKESAFAVFLSGLSICGKSTKCKQ